MATIVSANTIAEVGALIGDVARASILSALMGGHAMTAGELARHAGVTAQTASGHLARMTDARLVIPEKQGRHRYYRLASPDVAHALSALMMVAADGPRRHHPIGPRDAALRLARTCYDHLAGRLALAVTDALCDRGLVSLADGAGLVTPDGERFFSEFGVALDAGRAQRPLCRTCLDWSERRPHIAGRLGAQMLDRLLTLNWIARIPDSRALRITPVGERSLVATFRLPSDWRVEPARAA